MPDMINVMHRLAKQQVSVASINDRMSMFSDGEQTYKEQSTIRGEGTVKCATNAIDPFI